MFHTIASLWLMIWEWIDQLIMVLIISSQVGEACLKFDQIFRVAQGMYFSRRDKGGIRQMLDNWPGYRITILNTRTMNDV
jgi:hypothetical protein